MNKVWLIIQREFLNRVQKKSFLIATILLPLIFPTIMAVLVYLKVQQEKNADKKIVYYHDESNLFKPDTTKFIFIQAPSDINEAKEAFKKDEHSFALLHIIPFNLSAPKGFTLYTKVNVSPTEEGAIENILEDQIRTLKMEKFNVDKKLLDSLKTDVSLNSVNLGGDKEEQSNTGVLLGVGVTCGILMYMFIFIYGAQIMQGIIEEKTSKVVEVIVSSVRPFQLMLGKIVGLASVGLLQFLIWIILITTLTTAIFAYFGIETAQQHMISQGGPEVQAMQNQAAQEFADKWQQIPFGYIIVNFLFYFVGGYLLYGALFAAVGSAVDSPAEAQQFMFPITLPMLISYFGLFTFIIDDPHGNISIWLSMIPFTSPIAMIGRIPFQPPIEQLIISQILLVVGFILTTWIAGRIYRIGILMHGTKVNYKVLVKWFMQKG
jgi:ABC-2 type transport system permease protein